MTICEQDAGSAGTLPSRHAALGALSLQRQPPSSDTLDCIHESAVANTRGLPTLPMLRDTPDLVIAHGTVSLRGCSHRQHVLAAGWLTLPVHNH